MISVIIPAYNEADVIEQTVKAVLQNSHARLVKEVIVVDGNSTDDTVRLATLAGALAVVSPQKGRAAQMNYGSSLATQPILYFLHADTLPPAHFDTDVVNALNNEFVSGCFMLAFDYKHWFLKANCWFTRFNTKWFRFGDQSLFVLKDVFDASGGFDESLIVMEDQEIINRLQKKGKFKVIKKPVVTSARKYLDNGIYKTQGVFFLIYFMYYLGFTQLQMVSTYKKLFRQNKV